MCEVLPTPQAFSAGPETWGPQALDSLGRHDGVCSACQEHFPRLQFSHTRSQAEDGPQGFVGETWGLHSAQQGLGPEALQPSNILSLGFPRGSNFISGF